MEVLKPGCNWSREPQEKVVEPKIWQRTGDERRDSDGLMSDKINELVLRAKVNRSFVRRIDVESPALSG